MRELILDSYRVMYRLSGVRTLAFIFALLYITVLNFVMLYGMGRLVEGWLPYAALVRTMCSFPYFFITASLLLLLTFSLMPRWRMVTRKEGATTKHLPLILYTFFSIVLFVYTRL